MDLYTLTARIYPSLLIASPLVAAVHAWVPDALDWKALLPTLVGGGAVAFFLAQVGRDKGKELEPRLFNEWGGVPTTRMLRHRHSPNASLVARYHSKLSQLLGQPMPTVDDEKAHRSQADQRYEAAVKYLRNETRDKKAFPLVFKENVNYGFRRNLLAMRGAGIAIAILAALACFVAGGWAMEEGRASLQAFLLGAVVALWLTWLLLRVRAEWVKLAAFAYAERLLESIDTLAANARK